MQAEKVITLFTNATKMRRKMLSLFDNLAL